jgi:hypothetical protein
MREGPGGAERACRGSIQGSGSGEVRTHGFPHGVGNKVMISACILLLIAAAGALAAGRVRFRTKTLVRTALATAILAIVAFVAGGVMWFAGM